jgi:tryptophan halogenase
LSPEQAEREMRQHLGPVVLGCEPNHIQMRIGRCRNSWVKNCVAIGLASGFVEPLESTGIFFIQHGIEELVRHFPGAETEEVAVRSYNRQIAACIDGVRDFLVIHYRATDRADTEFWRATQQAALPDSLAERLPLWAKRMPNERNVNPSYHGFDSYSYSVMLLGLNYRPPASLPVLDHLDDGNALKAFQSLRERADLLRGSLPSQYEYLTHMRQQAGVIQETLA